MIGKVKLTPSRPRHAAHGGGLRPVLTAAVRNATLSTGRDRGNGPFAQVNKPHPIPDLFAELPGHKRIPQRSQPKRAASRSQARLGPCGRSGLWLDPSTTPALLARHISNRFAVTCGQNTKSLFRHYFLRCLNTRHPPVQASFCGPAVGLERGMESVSRCRGRAAVVGSESRRLRLMIRPRGLLGQALRPERAIEWATAHATEPRSSPIHIMSGTGFIKGLAARQQRLRPTSWPLEACCG